MRGETILIIDDEKLIRWSLEKDLTRSGFDVFEAENCSNAISILQDCDPDLIILDQMLPDGTGIELLQKIKESKNGVPVIMLTAVDKSDIAVQAMKLGAHDYVTKPINFDELKIVIEKSLESTRLKRQFTHLLKYQQKKNGFSGLIGSSPPMLQVYEKITKIAASNGTTVLITGESGTGKELVARAVHFLSDRKDKPLMTVNCAALTESLIESELFGYERGAFTDAKNKKKGIFEIADSGTVFLDEIGDISPKLQVKLLRVLEQKSFQRVGGTTDINVDVRIIAATNRALQEKIAEGTFRTDLFYRLSVATINLPPLRERSQDILLLAENFLQEFNLKFNRQFTGFAEETKQLFLNYYWRGNVRELKNVMERTILLNEDDYIQPHHIEFSHLLQQQKNDNPYFLKNDEPKSLDELEKQALLQALEKTNYNQTQAAKLLKISRDTIRYRIKKHNIVNN